MRSQPDGVAAIVARIRLDAASKEMADAFRSEVAALERLPGAAHDDTLEGVERNLRRWSRWLVRKVAPADRDFDPLREWARVWGSSAR